MAGLNVNFGQNFLQGLLGTEAEAVCIEALTEAAPILQESMKREARAVVEHDGDSEMVESISVGKPKKTKDGSAFIINVGPKGYSTIHDRNGRKTQRKKKITNASKMIWKEYGVSGRQAPHPFLDRATNNVKQAAVEKIQEIYSRMVGR